VIRGLIQVLSLVELEPIRGNIVGKPGESGLSVEQRKRLTIAVELVANPSIVFMDEPTSGAAGDGGCPAHVAASLFSVEVEQKLGNAMPT
jgi:ABC-type phosphonate transport system ATPase subunit